MGVEGEPALVDSTSPRRGEQASYYSAVCLETGEVAVMELAGNSNSASSADFLRQLRARHTEPLTVIWDNSPAHRGDALRAYLTTPGLNLRLVNPVSSTGQALPSYRPDFNADEAVWGWARQDVTANLCLGARAAVPEKVGDFFANLAGRRDEVKRRCRTVLQARVAELSGSAHADFTALQMWISPWLQFRRLTRDIGARSGFGAGFAGVARFRVSTAGVGRLGEDEGDLESTAYYLRARRFPSVENKLLHPLPEYSCGRGDNSGEWDRQTKDEGIPPYVFGQQERRGGYGYRHRNTPACTGRTS